MLAYSCPSEFTYHPNGSSCVLKCPTAKNYQMTSSGSMVSCTHTADKTVSAQLMAVPQYLYIVEGTAPASWRNSPGRVFQPNLSYKMLPNKQVYQNEVDRFANDIAVADEKINKDLKLNTAFRALQDAENARDKAPDAYQTARVAYYTLLKGDTWVEEEKNRVANTEAQPVINNFLDKYKSLQYTRSRQQAVIDSMNNVKQSVLGVKDDLDFSVSNFQKHIEDIKNQINKDKRDQDIQLSKATTWIEVLLNWLIALASLIAIFFLGRYLMRPKPGQAPSDSDIMSYLRRSAYGSRTTTPTRR